MIVALGYTRQDFIAGRLAELQTVRGRLGLPIERDLHSAADKIINTYAREARRAEVGEDTSLAPQLRHLFLRRAPSARHRRASIRLDARRSSATIGWVEMVETTVTRTPRRCSLSPSRGQHIDCARMDLLRSSIQQMMGAQRPYRPVNVAFPKVWKCRSNPTNAAEAASFSALGSLSTSTAKTVIW
jgi:hypothetical protein